MTREEALRRAVAELATWAREATDGLAESYRAEAEEVAVVGAQVADELVAGRMTLDQAERSIERLTAALTSRIFAAGYATKALRVELAGRALAVALRLAAGLLAAA